MADPMYRQIADDLRRQIESGELSAGSQLWTEIELRDRYDASRNTVRDAVKWLIARGLVETRPGHGTFVVRETIPLATTLTGDPEAFSGGVAYTWEVRGVSRTPVDMPPQVGIQDTNAEMASELLTEVGTPVVSRHQQRFIDGMPWSLQTSFYPMRLVEQGAVQLLQAANIEEKTVAYLEQGIVAYLRDTLGIKQKGYRDKVLVRTPDENEARFFRLPDDGRIAVIETRRIAFSEDGNPIRLTVSVYPADRAQFAVDVGQVPSGVMGPPPNDAR